MLPIVAVGHPAAQTAPVRIPRKKGDSLLFLVVPLVAVALYLPTLGFGLVFDDRSLIAPDGPVALGNGTLPYRPLRYLSLLLDHHLGGGHPGVYHATNVFLHAFACLLAVAIGRRLGLRPLVAALAVLMFAVHPLAVEVVAYVAGRRDLLATACGLAALALWTSNRGLTAPALAMVLAGVAAKESALLYAPVLMAASLFGLGPAPSLGWRPLLWAMLAAIALPVAYGARGPLVPDGGLAVVAVTSGRLAWHYAAGVVTPVGLSVEYPYLRCGSDCTELWGAPAAAGLVLLLVLALLGIAAVGAGRRAARAVDDSAQRPCSRPVLFTLVWTALFALPLAVAIGAHEPGADRHAYPLLVPLALLGACCVQWFFERVEPGRLSMLASATAVTLLAVVLFALSLQRTRVWRDERSLWTATVASTPRSARARVNLAAVLADEGSHRESRRQLRRALAIDERYAPAHVSLAWLACADGRPHAASIHLARARGAGADAGRLRAAEERCVSLPATP